MSDKTTAGPEISRIIYPSNFWFLPRTALFHPTEGEGAGGEPGDEGAQEDSDAGDAGEEGSEGGEQKKKLVSLERHQKEVNKLKARLKTYEDADSERKKSEMSENDRLKTENEELSKRVQKYEGEEKKSDALSKAKKALAKAGRMIDPEREDSLIRSVRRLAFNSETLDDDVAELVELASIAGDKKGYRSVAGKTGKSQDGDRDPREYTTKELKEIRAESVDRYDSVMARRKQLDEEDRKKAQKR